MTNDQLHARKPIPVVTNPNKTVTVTKLLSAFLAELGKFWVLIHQQQSSTGR
jgi:hypothetical protein